jgi:hypothetical protein
VAARRPKAESDHLKTLDQVICLGEAVRTYKIPRNTLRYAIDLGCIAAVRSGRNVIIHKQSLENYIFDH